MGMKFWASLSAGLVVFVASPVRAQTVDVDKLLGVLAEVIQDRAKQVAAETVKARLLAGVCGEDLKLEANGRVLLLHLGRRQCVDRDKDSPCTADDLFVKTCRLAKATGGTSLTDVSFLKTVAADTIGLTIRLAAFSIDAPSFSDAGLDVLGPVLYRLAEVLSQPGHTDDDVAQVLLEFSDALATDHASDTLATLGSSLETKQLMTDVVNALSKTDTTSVLGTDQLTATISCKDWDDARAKRGATYVKLFETAGSGYPEAANKPCPTGSKECAAAQLGLRLGDLLKKLECKKTGDDARKAYRQLGYVITEKNLYEQAFAELGTAGSQHLDDFIAAAATQVAPVPPRDELARGVRLVGTALRARSRDRAELERWLKALDVDARAAVDAGNIDLLRRSEALNWSNRDTWPDSVRAVREAAKDLIAHPRVAAALQLGAPRSGEQQKARLDALRSMAELFQRLLVMSQKPAAEDSIGVRVAALLRAIAGVAGAMEGGGEAATAMKEALKLGGDVVALAEQRDWIGLALASGDALGRLLPGAIPPEVANALRFVRVLMAVHQAKSPDEAKATFASALQEITSRAERYGVFSIDVAALVAVRAGWQHNDNAKEGLSQPASANEFMAGLFAPVGLQLASGCVGLLIYPLDLGSYLLANTSGTPPKASAAVRIGATFSLRPWADVPIDFGLGYDYRPAFDAWVEHRAFGFAALELPLFIIH